MSRFCVTFAVADSGNRIPPADLLCFASLSTSTRSKSGSRRHNPDIFLTHTLTHTLFLCLQEGLSLSLSICTYCFFQIDRFNQARHFLLQTGSTYIERERERRREENLSRRSSTRMSREGRYVVASSIRESSCVSRSFNALVLGTCVGATAGTVAATWSDTARVTIGQRTALGALQGTLGVVARNAVGFGMVGLAFASVECAAESFREKKDHVNGVMGGTAAGAVLGIRHGSMRTALASAVLMSAGVTLMDIFKIGETETRGEGLK